MSQNNNNNNYGMSDFQYYVYLSRYSRFLHDKGRRETWSETIERYFDFFEGHLKNNCSYTLSKELRKELEEAILNHEIMPSMRCVMTAGPALERDEISGYNCSYVAIDSPKSFSELMMILMCGTGVGFSVENQYVNKLPEIPEELTETDSIIVVADSKIGWAKALSELFSMLYAGHVPHWDLSKIRPAGEILKVFGGRASGPAPLEKAFKFIVKTFVEAKGRKLTSLECHDICCVIGECIVSGGGRRSATISLSDLTDDKMRHAKAGQWWSLTPWRSNSNNSAVYNDKKPTMDVFMSEWKSLYDSKSGERGMFSRYAAKNVINRANDFRKQHFGDNKNIRYRNNDFEWGCNPCVTKDMMVSTSEGIKSVESLIDKPFFALVNGKEYKSNGFWYSGHKDVYEVKTSRGNSFKATGNHKILHADGIYRELDDTKIGDNLQLNSWAELTKAEQELLTAEVVSIVHVGKDDVYDCEVDEVHCFDVDGVLVHNCSEIILRDKQFCNLTEVVIGEKDTPKDLERKVRLATILGTFQSTLTNFRFISKKWQTNTEDERLLGVSLTGIMDNTLMSGKDGKDKLKNALTKLRMKAIETNLEYSKKLGIESSTAITCVKPSGTVSSLVNSAAGIHARHSHYYIRSVRSDKKDPLAQLLIDSGVPHESDKMRPDSTWVFYFPIKSPRHSVFRDQLSALEQLDIWLTYQLYWCDHKPSVTISVKEDEWMKAGSWVYDNFEWISGISFLPFSEHNYEQAPYQECTKEEYDAMVAKMPKTINWEKLSDYENNDMTTGSQELSCAAGGCDI